MICADFLTEHGQPESGNASVFDDAILDVFVRRAKREFSAKSLAQKTTNPVRTKQSRSRLNASAYQRRFYDATDIFINASWLDNMPVSILEAFASDTPVVSSAQKVWAVR